MRRILFLLFCFCLATSSYSQYRVRFLVTEKGPVKHDSIYLAGNFNRWNAVPDNSYHLQSAGAGERVLTLTLPQGNYAYKYHRGSWLKVEKAADGQELPNRMFTVNRDITIRDTVEEWRDLIIPNKWQEAATEKSDTNRVRTYMALAKIYAMYPEYVNTDSALYYCRMALQQLHDTQSSKEMKAWPEAEYVKWFVFAQETVAAILHSLGNYSKALEIKLDNWRLVEKGSSTQAKLHVLWDVGSEYVAMKDYAASLHNARKMQALLAAQPANMQPDMYYYTIMCYYLADAFYNLNQLDSALLYAQKSNAVSRLITFPNGTVMAQQKLADIYAKKGDIPHAFDEYRSTISLARQNYMYHTIALVYQGMARLYEQQGLVDSALHYARQAFEVVNVNKRDILSWGENLNTYLADISPLVARLYKKNNQLDSAYKFLQFSVDIKDSLYNLDKIRQFQNLAFNESLRQQQESQKDAYERLQLQNKIRFYSLGIAFLALMVIAILLYRNNKHKQRINGLLRVRKQELEKTLQELKTTQQQLIQKEKMASLGELTAGIAHEIQNPLNFITNFSELNLELVDELQAQLKSGRTSDALDLSESFKENLEKIDYHGKRADSIVKGMLQHSRKTGSTMEPTDVNAMVGEYLRLSYHGIRAKDPNFHAVMETHFDPAVGTVPLIPQDIGRVLLNLFNNAFYSVKNKKSYANGTFEPVVQVTTKRGEKKISIAVRDNGLGMPVDMISKIYQPFFTTKPPGEGTGLGLSMSYDIITKAHNGDLRVSTKEGEYAEFTVELPFA